MQRCHDSTLRMSYVYGLSALLFFAAGVLGVLREEQMTKIISFPSALVLCYFTLILYSTAKMFKHASRPKVEPFMPATPQCQSFFANQVLSPALLIESEKEEKVTSLLIAK